MKNIILIKQHSCVQLAHLYEHLFLRTLNEFFYENRLFKSIDYAVDGTTFEHGGVITIDITLYSREAQVLAPKIKLLQIKMGDDNKNIISALTQIMAEELHQLHATDKQEVLDELRLLDGLSWRDVDDLSYLDTRAVRRKHTPMYLGTKLQKKPKTLRITLSLSDSYRSPQLPLFNIVARFLLLTIGNSVTSHYGLYAGELHVGKSTRVVVNELLVIPRLVRDIDVEIVADLAFETITYMLYPEVISRFTREIAATNYRNHSSKAPDFARIFQQTGVLVGSKGWKELTTPEMVQSVVDNMIFRVQLGRHSTERKIKQEL